MKKIITFFLALALGLFFTKAQVHFKLASYAQELVFDSENKPVYLKLKEQLQVPESESAAYIQSLLMSKGGTQLFLIRKEEDVLGYMHYRFGIKLGDLPIYGKQIVAHCKEGKLISFNGDMEDFSSAGLLFSLTEQVALSKALAKVNARHYMWQNKEEEEHMRRVLNQPDFTYYPHGKKVVFEKEGKFFPAWMFNIYADAPLYRANVFVHASSGKILDEHNLICTADVPATASTKYSGTQTITCDQQTPTLYRLRETQRGNGIETYNLNNTSNYNAATDFTNSSTSWTVVNVDQAATDAHWGAEMTYDYYWNIHNRNSIDNNGFKLLSYVHYNTNYNNAFWDGQRMTYGDGNGTTFTILTGLDVCGHEVTHGLTSNSSQLIYSNESGALNESYSDIFGTMVENYGRPNNWDWKIGVDITPNGNGIRNMQNPKQFNHPNTYQGQYYYTGPNDNGGVHTNSGVSNFWFYLLSAGGTGTNDVSSSYTVNGIGMQNAAKIAFRALTVYYTPNTNFANARILSIQAAKDLFGVCSNEVIQTTNAWHAVGVGAQYNPSVINPDFTANLTSYCSLPATVNFNNTTVSGSSYFWDFGDGGTSTATNAVYSYTANGTYHVKLKAVGCNSNVDSIIKTSYITINAPANPLTTGASTCVSGALTLTASAPNIIKWYSNPSLTTQVGSGTLFTTPTLTSSTTYYVVNTTTNASVNGGILTNTGGGNLNNNTHYLIFNVLSGAMLETIDVYAAAAGNATIQLRNSNNTVLNSFPVSLVSGLNTVTLNLSLSPGNNYRLGLSQNTNLSMYRSNTGVSYPYNIASCVSIHNSSAGSGFYYWFYNWKVKKDDCVSAAVPVTAVINPLPSLNITASSGTTICRTAQPATLIGTPSGGTFSGNGVSGNQFNPSVGVGVYTVTYSYTDANSCSNTTSLLMTVVECTGLNEQSIFADVLLMPNPATDFIKLKNIPFGTDIKISDVTGKVIFEVMNGKHDVEIQTATFAPGIYFIRLQNREGLGSGVFKVVKQ